MASTGKTTALDANGNLHDRQRIPNGSGNRDLIRKSPGDPGTRYPRASIAAALLSPALLTTFILIFGGCCSNVYTLESILSLSPATGSLITFLQFLFTSFFTLPSQLTTKSTAKPGVNSSLIPHLKSRSVPLSKWLIYTTFFLTVNILNNRAFNYRISIPLHIILRSAGPVTSMLVGYFVAGSRYTTRKIVAVMLLFCGVVMAALADASSKSKVSIKSNTGDSELSKQAPGFVLLFSALLVSAYMGIYTDGLYKKYGRSAAVANESLFYSHILALPFFAAQYKSLYSEYLVMVANASSSAFTNFSLLSKNLSLPVILQPVASHLPESYLSRHNTSPVPIFLLLANAVTQIVCITGVQRLSTQTSSLTVSIVLNIRKLVSLLLSIWLFGNKLPIGVAIGAVVVFSGGLLYGLPSSSKAKDQGKKTKIEATKKNR